MTGPANAPDLPAAVAAPAVRPAALDALERAALTADAAEKRFRATFAQEVERLEVARRHAFRRYAFLKALIVADASAPDLDASRTAQLRAAAEELEWSEIDAARRPVLDALAPLTEAVHAARVALQGGEGEAAHSENPEAPSPAGLRPATSPQWGEVKDAASVDEPILAALAAFEAWHLDVRGKPFGNLFDRYVQETPLVDF